MDYKTGMYLYGLAFLLGIVLVQQLAVLPDLPTLFLVFSFLCLCWFICIEVYRQKQQDLNKQIALIIIPILMIIIGIIYASLYAKQQLLLRLDEALIGHNIVINGQVANIPLTDDEVQRFEFYVESSQLSGAESELDTAGFPRKLRLSWYYGQTLNAGERWQLEVRLKPPHGFLNPGGFDYEAWLFQNGIHATGYVRKSSFNKRQQDSPASINAVRQSISRQIDAIAAEPGTIIPGVDRPDAAAGGSFSLLKALAIGDKSTISNKQWRVLTDTGTSHLMAISGLHIGLASLFGYLLIRRLVPVYLMKRIPAQHVALCCGLLTAFLYALLAGLSVPTQRAIIMLSILSMMVIVRRNHRPVDALGFALFTVLLIDPLAVLSAGFWFSFSAVAVIFISLSTSTQAANDDKGKVSFVARVVATLKRWIRLQMLISLFLLPLSLFMFQQVSLVSPLANLLLIPYVSFLVVPVVLLAIICSFLLPPVSAMLYAVAAFLLDLVWPLLSYLASMPHSLWVRGDVGVLSLLSASFAMLLLLYSGQLSVFLFRRAGDSVQKYACWFFRCTLCLLFVPLLIPAKPVSNAAEYLLTVLDVGQGSAAVIQTLNHVAVFDAGARFSDRLNAGSGVVIPFLRTRSIQHLDRLIISHGDADHIGGAQAILDEYPEAIVIGQDIENLSAIEKRPCYAGTGWSWDGVEFEFLSPDKGDDATLTKVRRNDHSCVLKVSSRYGSVLFTGDIEYRTENKLLEKYSKQLDSDMLIVPHHGSNTSSGAAFIKAVDPVISIISAGYSNRYRLPDHRVIERYDSMQRDWLQTDKTGAISINMAAGSAMATEKYREIAGKYWHHISDKSQYD